MPSVIFRVTAVNDLSSDGANTKRVILEAAAPFIGTGPVHDVNDPKAFPSNAMVRGRFELVVDNRTQAFYFPIGANYTVELPLAPAPETPKADETAAADLAAKDTHDADAARIAEDQRIADEDAAAEVERKRVAALPKA